MEKAAPREPAPSSSGHDKSAKQEPTTSRRGRGRARGLGRGRVRH